MRRLALLVPIALTLLALSVPVAVAQQPQTPPSQGAPGTPFGPLPQPAPTPPPTNTQTQTQTQKSTNSGGSDSGPGKGTLALLFVAAILVLGAATYAIARDARRTVKPKRRGTKRPRTAEASGARPAGAPPPPPRKGRRKRRSR